VKIDIVIVIFFGW